MGEIMGSRYLAITSIIRYNQIEVAHDRFIGNDESQMVSLENARRFRETVLRAYPGGSITWALSYGALISGQDNFRELRDYVKECHAALGDDVTYFVGGFFANAYSPIDKINRELDEALTLLEQLMGPGYRPRSVIAGFLSSHNQQYLAQRHSIHAVSYTHLTLPTRACRCRSRWSPYH